MKIKSLLLSLFLPVIVFSQAYSSLLSRVHIIGSAGVAGGETAVQPLLQVAGGINYGKYFTGIGAGIDGYRFYSLPVFADWRMYVGKMNSVFFYTNAGYNFPLQLKAEDGDIFKTMDRYKGGFYMDAGIGCRLAMGEKHRFLISTGYSLKNTRNVQGYTYPCLVGPCLENIYNYRYRLGRIVTKLSWEFGRSPGAH